MFTSVDTDYTGRTFAYRGGLFAMPDYTAAIIDGLATPEITADVWDMAGGCTAIGWTDGAREWTVTDGDAATPDGTYGLYVAVHDGESGDPLYGWDLAADALPSAADAVAAIVAAVRGTLAPSDVLS